MPKDMLMICPQCLKEYTLGINGVYNGCDECEGITRNSKGMIIYDLPGEKLITHVTQQQETKQS